MRKLGVRTTVLTPLVAAVLLSTGGCSSVPKVDLVAEEKAIRAAETAWVDTVPTGDVDKVLAFYAEDAVMLPPGEAVANGKAAIRASWTQLLGLTDLKLTWAPTKVEVAKSGDLAYDVGTYAMSYKDASGKAVNDIGKFSTVWRKGATGGWKVAVDIINTDLPAPKAAVKKATPKKTAPKAKQKKR